MFIINHHSSPGKKNSNSHNLQCKILELTITCLIVTCLVFTSCSNNSKPSDPKQTGYIKNINKATDTLVSESKLHADNRDSVEVMDEKDILLNGKLKRYFSLIDFKANFGEPDSSKLLSDVEPCTSIFEEADGSVNPQAKYLYKNGSRFENSGNKVAIDEINFDGGDHILYKGHLLNKSTTISDIKGLFPNAIKHIGEMDVFGEGKLQVIQLREDYNNVSDGHVKIFFKNGKLHLLHWWFPC